MSIRKKTLLAIFATLVVLIGVLFATSQLVIMSSFDALEREDAAKNTERSRSAFHEVLNGMSTKTADWSAWDDTYAFASDHNRDYVESNLLVSSFAAMKLNFVVIMDRSGKMVYGQAYDIESNRMVKLPGDLGKHLSPDSKLLSHKSTDSSVEGLVMLREGPAMIVSQPIVKSTGDGPIRGSILFGRFLDSEETKRLSQVTHLSLTTYAAGNTSLPPDCADAFKSIKAKEVRTSPRSENSIAGYALLSDIYGKPAVLVKAEMPRDIHSHGVQSVNYLITAFLIAVTIFAVVMILLLDKLVLTPLAKLNKLASYTMHELGLQ